MCLFFVETLLYTFSLMWPRMIVWLVRDTWFVFAVILRIAACQDCVHPVHLSATESSTESEPTINARRQEQLFVLQMVLGFA